MPRPQRETATAYHEAGHAVMAWHFGLRLKKKRAVTIVSNGDSYGQCRISSSLRGNPEVDASDRMRLTAERRAIASLAGIEAQRKHNPRSVRKYHSQQDYQNAMKLMTYFVGSQQELEAYMNLLVIRTRQIVTLPSIWLLIQGLADDLRKRHEMTREQVLMVISKTLANGKKGK